jgi:hypothetical protein
MMASSDNSTKRTEASAPTEKLTEAALAQLA